LKCSLILFDCVTPVYVIEHVRVTFEMETGIPLVLSTFLYLKEQPGFVPY